MPSCLKSDISRCRIALIGSYVETPDLKRNEINKILVAIRREAQSVIQDMGKDP